LKSKNLNREPLFEDGGARNLRKGMMDLIANEKLKSVIDAEISRIESIDESFKCPANMQKTYYLKSNWLLYMLKKTHISLMTPDAIKRASELVETLRGVCSICKRENI